MLEKYREHLKRKQLKRDAQIFSEIMKKYELRLLLRNSLDDLAILESNDDFRQILVHRNHLDGDVSILLRKIVSAAGEKLPLCIDVGANYGLATVFLAKHSERVIAFEPEPKNIERMEGNLSANRITNVEIERVALSNKNGLARFYTSEASSHHSLGLAHPILRQDNFIEVKTMTLDSFCAARNIQEISILKVDTEGFELEVLQGAESLLRNRLIKNLVFETSRGVMARLGRNPQEHTDFLFALGYRICTPDGQFISPAELAKAKHQDFLAVPPR